MYSYFMLNIFLSSALRHFSLLVEWETTLWSGHPFLRTFLRLWEKNLTYPCLTLNETSDL